MVEHTFAKCKIYDTKMSTSYPLSRKQEPLYENIYSVGLADRIHMRYSSTSLDLSSISAHKCHIRITENRKSQLSQQAS